MSFWPRFKLTPQEEKKKVAKYYDPETGKRGVLRKLYSGHLSLTASIRQPVLSFQIARRCRIFGLTASGDIPQFKIQISDSSGEQYLAQPVTMAALFGGYAELPPPAFATPPHPIPTTGGFPPKNTSGSNTLAWQRTIGMPFTANPLIFEPNIVLDSNQVLQVVGYPLTDYDSVDYRVDMCFHVWEFPAWQNGPA